MITRSYDPELMKTAVDMANNPSNEGLDHKAWLADHRNMMYTEDGNVGLATFEYPGVYNLHWLFVTRGRGAFDMANRMLYKFFTETDCKTIRGLTPVDNRAACWLARQIGCTSYGTVECLTGPHELFLMTKEDFMDRKR